MVSEPPSRSPVLNRDNTCAMAERKDKSELPSGWSRVGLQIPDSLADELARARGRLPGQLSKLVGTAAIAAFVSLPHDIQLMLYRWAHVNELEPDKSHHQEALVIIVEMLRRHLAEQQQNVRPLTTSEKQVLRNVFHLLGDRQEASPEVTRLVQNLEVFDQEEADRKEREFREAFLDAEVETRHGTPSPQLPMPSPETHEVTRILDPGILKRKKKGGAA